MTGWCRSVPRGHVCVVGLFEKGCFVFPGQQACCLLGQWHDKQRPRITAGPRARPGVHGERSAWAFGALLTARRPPPPPPPPAPPPPHPPKEFVWVRESHMISGGGGGGGGGGRTRARARRRRRRRRQRRDKTGRQAGRLSQENYLLFGRMWWS